MATSSRPPPRSKAGCSLQVRVSHAPGAVASPRRACVCSHFLCNCHPPAHTYTSGTTRAGSSVVMGTTNTHYRAFKFGRCTPAEDAETVQSLAEIKAGLIRVQLQQVVAMGQRGAYTNLAAAGPGSAATDVKLPDHKKVGERQQRCLDGGAAVSVVGADWHVAAARQRRCVCVCVCVCARAACSSNSTLTRHHLLPSHCRASWRLASRPRPGQSRQQQRTGTPPSISR
jgi:hypothetical protein